MRTYQRVSLLPPKAQIGLKLAIAGLIILPICAPLLLGAWAVHEVLGGERC